MLPFLRAASLGRDENRSAAMIGAEERGGIDGTQILNVLNAGRLNVGECFKTAGDAAISDVVHVNHLSQIAATSGQPLGPQQFDGLHGVIG